MLPNFFVCPCKRIINAMLTIFNTKHANSMAYKFHGIPYLLMFESKESDREKKESYKQFVL